ncbi:MAG: right-handed parallel beta-helix repeat-containing protein [Candidatus Bathyarchaeota archaeon]|nr:right-handed parallel beta-helix repeat-containing protein [Candidatus Bathyarchaeota archaeon]
MKRSLSKIAALSVVVSFAAFLTGLPGFASANFFFQIEHNSGIFIRSDGTIEPLDSPILCSGNTYTFTANITTGFAVECSDVIVDGAGFCVQGIGEGTGCLIKNASNVTVRNLHFAGFRYGIFLTASNNAVITQNNITGCGIEIQSSSGNLITDNKVSRNINFGDVHDSRVLRNTASSLTLSWSSTVTVTNNTFSDPERVDRGLRSVGDEGAIYVDNCGSCGFFNNTLERKAIGVNIWQSTNLIFSGNTLRDNQVGFKLWGSDLQHNLQSIDNTNTVNGNPVYFLVNRTNFQVPPNAGWIAAVDCENITVQNWVSTPNWDGILFLNVKNAKITCCNLTGNFNAIHLISSRNIEISKNLIVNNGYAAIYLKTAAECTITENHVADNYCLFNMRDNSKNTIWLNDFFGNWTGPIDSGDQNRWDNGTTGNYWSLLGCYVDENHDGIHDTAFQVKNNLNVDNYPLMVPFNAGNWASLPSPTSTTSPTPSPTPTASPTVPELSTTSALAAFGLVTCVIALAAKKKLCGKR